MKSVMTNRFDQVPQADIPRSSFRRPSGLKTTMDADYLVPIFVDDVIPGDTHALKASHFTRLATPLHPIMDNMYVETFFFFVPYRTIWDNFEKFCGAQTDPGDSIDYTIPVISSAATHDMTALTTSNQLLNYMFAPQVSSLNLGEMSSLPLRAYNKIFNDWFRSQDLQDSLPEVKGDGPDGLGPNYDLRKRGKRHDYFTSCLPWPQKGTAVSVPLGDSAPITGTGAPIFDNTGGTLYGSLQTDASNPGNITIPNATGGGADFLTWRDSGLTADLENATAATINDWRLAFQTQRLLERDARSGTRYVETLKAHWGVTSPDMRLQRAEYLGGGSDPINISPVAQTSGQPNPTSDDGLGQLAAVGTARGTHGFNKSFVEHGVIIGLANVRADLTYSQGVERYFTKSTRFDFYYPVLSQIGEQAVLNREIYYQNTSADDDAFGYQERYAEYRFKPSRVTGLFDPNNAATLASWHLSEEFTSLPALGDTFIQSNAIDPIDRAIQIPAEPQFIMDWYFDLTSARPMPMYGVPGNMDRL